MGKKIGVTFLGLWWAEFHAEKEMGAKMVGLPGSAVSMALCYIWVNYNDHETQSLDIMVVFLNEMSSILFYLVGGLEHLDYFSIQSGIVIQTDELIFFRGVAIAPTRQEVVERKMK